MFKRNTVPQRKPFHLRKEHILQDISDIKESEEQRNKLFLCLDEKPPVEHKFNRLEEFLKGTNNLEDMSHTLTIMVTEMDTLKKEIAQCIDELKSQTNNIKLEEFEIR